MRQGILKDYSDILVAIVAVMDLLVIIGCGHLTYYFFSQSFLLPDHLKVTLIFSILLAWMVFKQTNIYGSWRGKGWFSLARTLFLSWSLAFILMLTIDFLLGRNFDEHRNWYFLYYLTSLVAITSFRFAIFIILKHLRSTGRNQRKIAIFGAGDLGRNIYHSVKDTKWSGLHVKFFIDDNIELNGQHLEGIPILAGVEELSAVCNIDNLDELWITIPLRSENRLKEILHQLRHSTITIRYVPDIFGFHLLNHSVDEIATYPIINLSSTPLKGFNKLIKHLEDKVIAFIILLLISPLLFVISIAVKLSSPGPIFYRQTRLSWNGKPFEMLKFRSMPVDVESKSGAVWAKSGESRATTVGSFLRKTSLDELPQFINVLKGEMSIVGPRPERPVFVDQFKDQIPGYMKKHMVRAGITGWAQVNGWRGDTDLQKRIDCDLYYINNWSLWFDIKIIVLTMFKGFINKNAY